MDDQGIPDEVADLPVELRALPPVSQDSAKRYVNGIYDVEMGRTRDWPWLLTFVVCCIALGGLIVMCAGWLHAAVEAHQVEVPGRIDVEFLPETDTKAMVGQCDWMGGELIFSDQDHTWVCEDVDK